LSLPSEECTHNSIEAELVLVIEDQGSIRDMRLAIDVNIGDHLDLAVRVVNNTGAPERNGGISVDESPG
jgi:hypothetical protein